jgi:ABC-type transport system substrate-binding protein/DNA-binding SARP family transcriptional activator/streptogramin lyase
MDYRLLGTVEVSDAGRAIPLGRGKVRALLALLLLHAGEPVSTDRLVEALWGERAPASAANSVHVYVSQLRKALGDARVVTRAGGYSLELDGDGLDCLRFEQLAAEGRTRRASGDAAGAAAILGEALALWRGPALADVAYEPFAAGESARLEEARLAALEERIDAELELGADGALVPELEALVREHPLRERARGQLMLALYRAGRQADALAAYREGRALLVGELGLEPGPALRDLEQAMLRQDPALARPPAPAPPRGRSRRPAVAVVAAAALLLAAALGAAVVELTRGSAGITDVSPNSLAAIDPGTNRIVGEVPVGARPGAVAFGAGSVWVGNRDDASVSRVSPATLAVVRTVGVGAEPTGLAGGPHGVWVVDADPFDPDVSVRRIDPRFDVPLAPRRLSNVLVDGPGSVAAGGGALWVAPSSGLLTRLDPATGRLLRQIDPNTSPSAIAAGAGALWLPNTDADTVTRVDPTGLRTTIPVGRGPAAVAVGEGAVWVVDSLDDELVRIDPSTDAPVDSIRVGRFPTAVAVGFGSVWVANARDGTVTRLDPSSGAKRTIHVGGSPQSLAIAAGRVWVTVDAPFPQSPPQGGVARLESLADVESIDPARTYDPLEWQLLDATCAKLVNYPDRPSPAGSELQPEVAESLPQVSPDGLTYMFRIRPGFRFSSGEPVTAETFRFSIERALSKPIDGSGRNYLDDVVGAGAFMAGRAAHVAGLRARGSTLTVRLVTPEPDLPTRLALPFFCAVPSDMPSSDQGLRALPSAGPYFIASYTPGAGMVLERNPNYRGNRPHRLDRIVLTVGVSPQQQMADVASGRADYAMNVPRSDYGRTGLRFDVFPQLDMLALNTRRGLFTDVRLRRAVNYAIDRTALARLGDPYSQIPGKPTDQYLPPDVPGFHDVRIYPFRPDVAKAKALAGGRTRTAVLYVCDQPPCDRIAQVVTTDLAAIGITVVVKTFDVAELSIRLTRPDEPFDLAWVGWVGDYPDPDDWLNVLLQSGQIQPFDDPVWTRRLARAALLSGPKRYLTYGRLDAELARDAAPWVAYANRPHVVYLSSRLGCRTYQPVYGIDLAALCVRRPG